VCVCACVYVHACVHMFVVCERRYRNISFGNVFIARKHCQANVTEASVVATTCVFSRLTPIASCHTKMQGFTAPVTADSLLVLQVFVCVSVCVFSCP